MGEQWARMKWMSMCIGVQFLLNWKVKKIDSIELFRQLSRIAITKWFSLLSSTYEKKNFFFFLNHIGHVTWIFIAIYEALASSYCRL